MASKRAEGEWIPDFLVRYLNTGEPDPYDFGFLLRDWSESLGINIDEDASVDDLNEKDIARFAKWLKSSEGESAIGEVSRHSPDLIPSYVMMGQARRIPAGAWLLHYTNSDPFKSFDRGAVLDTPLWLTSTNSKSAVIAKCPRNLSEDVGPGEVVFGFAHEVSKARSYKTYGGNAVLFKSDLAVSSYHYSDEEHQAIFPVCSEYVAIAIYSANRRGGGTVYTDEGEDSFDTAEEIIAAYSAGKIGLSRGMTARSRLTRRSRWNPQIVPKASASRARVKSWR